MQKTSDLCDALDAIQACTSQFRSFGRRRAFAGPIRTVQCRDDIREMRKIVNEHGNGCVLVVDGGASLERAIFGDNMALLMIRNGWAGAVVNGAARDIAEIDTMDIGVKALGTVAKRGDMAGGGSIDVSVTFGGVTFVPECWVVADADGVIVLPGGMKPGDIDVTSGTTAYTQ